NVSGIAGAADELSQLGAQAQEAGGSVSELGGQISAAGDAGASLGDLTSEIDGVGTAFDDASTQGDSFFASMGNMGGGIGGLISNVGMGNMQLQMFTGTVQQLGQALLGPAETAETTQLAFTTLMHSSSAAQKELQALNTFAAGTPMQTQWVDDAASKMLAFGFKTSSIIPDITAIGDSLSGLGKLSSVSLNSIVDVFGKVQAAGKLTGGD